MARLTSRVKIAMCSRPTRNRRRGPHHRRVPMCRQHTDSAARQGDVIRAGSGSDVTSATAAFVRRAVPSNEKLVEAYNGSPSNQRFCGQQSRAALSFDADRDGADGEYNEPVRAARLSLATTDRPTAPVRIATYTRPMRISADRHIIGARPASGIYHIGCGAATNLGRRHRFCDVISATVARIIPPGRGCESACVWKRRRQEIGGVR